MIKLKKLLNEAKIIPGQWENVTKQNLIGRLYKELRPITKGFFRDQDWRNVNRVWKVFEKKEFKFAITGSDYYPRNGFPKEGKIWKFEVGFINNRGKKDKLYGRLVAAGAGKTEDPLERYDIVVTLG